MLNMAFACPLSGGPARKKLLHWILSIHDTMISWSHYKVEITNWYWQLRKGTNMLLLNIIFKLLVWYIFKIGGCLVFFCKSMVCLVLTTNANRVLYCCRHSPICWKKVDQITIKRHQIKIKWELQQLFKVVSCRGRTISYCGKNFKSTTARISTMLLIYLLNSANICT